MTAPSIDYRNTGIAVRDDIIASQTRAWQSLGAPGAWWTGAERVAIAREVRAGRRCAGCAERKSALSPYAVNAAHDAAANLPAAIVDAVHRVVTDPGRLSRRWVDEVMAAGTSDAQLVELVSVVCTVMLIDWLRARDRRRCAAAAHADCGRPVARAAERGGGRGLLRRDDSLC